MCYIEFLCKKKTLKISEEKTNRVFLSCISIRLEIDQPLYIDPINTYNISIAEWRYIDDDDINSHTSYVSNKHVTSTIVAVSLPSSRICCTVVIVNDVLESDSSPNRWFLANSEVHKCIGNWWFIGIMVHTQNSRRSLLDGSLFPYILPTGGAVSNNNDESERSDHI